MKCEGCVNRIKNVLENIKGILSYELSLEKKNFILTVKKIPIATARSGLLSVLLNPREPAICLVQLFSIHLKKDNFCFTKLSENIVLTITKCSSAAVS